MRPLAAILTIAALAALAAVPAAAQAATPRQATHRIAHCLKRHGAQRVVQRGRRGGKAYFPHRYDGVHRDYVEWFYFVVSNHQVVSTGTSSVLRTRHDRRAANRCLKPFHGSV